MAAQFASAGQQRERCKFERGTVLVQHGDSSSEHVYLLRKGSLAICLPLPSQPPPKGWKSRLRSSTAASTMSASRVITGAGELVGAYHHLLELPEPATIRVESAECELYKLSWAEVQKTLTQRMESELREKVQRCHELRVEAFSGQTPKERFAAAAIECRKAMKTSEQQEAEEQRKQMENLKNMLLEQPSEDKDAALSETSTERHLRMEELEDVGVFDVTGGGASGAGQTFAKSPRGSGSVSRRGSALSNSLTRTSEGCRLRMPASPRSNPGSRARTPNGRQAKPGRHEPAHGNDEEAREARFRSFLKEAVEKLESLDDVLTEECPATFLRTGEPMNKVQCQPPPVTSAAYIRAQILQVLSQDTSLAMQKYVHEAVLDPSKRDLAGWMRKYLTDNVFIKNHPDMQELQLLMRRHRQLVETPRQRPETPKKASRLPEGSRAVAGAQVGQTA